MTHSNQKHTPEPETFRKMLAQGAPDNSWRSDFSHENGMYTNKCTSCKKDFMGHKRRTYCYHCACVNAMQGIDDPEAFMRKVRQVFSESGELNFEVLSRIAEDLKGGE